MRHYVFIYVLILTAAGFWPNQLALRGLFVIGVTNGHLYA
jgi:hypothetical protein